MALVDRGPFRRAALKRYVSQMSSPDTHSVFDDFTAEILEQQGFQWEEDPRSIYEPQQLYTALERYATEWDKFEVMDEHLKFGFRKAYKIFAKPKDWEYLPVLSDQEIISKALKLEKSAGLPLMESKAASLTYSFDRERQIRRGDKAPNPCVAYKRTQKGNKTRLVWGYPLEMTIMESRFARPLIDRFKAMDTPMAFGMTKICLGAKLHRYIVDQPGEKFCFDYSKYDSTLSASMIKGAFRIMASWFRGEDLEALGWDTIKWYFIKTPIVMPDGHLYTGKNHGVPSGSYFTQLVDSIVNVAITYALAHRFNFYVDERSIYVMGDDSCFRANTQAQLRKWAQYLSKLGVVLHDDDKTVVGRVHFLGAFWDKGKPDAPIQELVNKACFPESFRDYEGKPHTGAISVLASYACNYLSAHRFLPTGIRLMARWKDFIVDDQPLETKHMTGSDRFLQEEKALLDRGKPDPVFLHTVSVRFMS